MATLHTVNKSPFEKNSLASCLSHLQSGYAVLLFEDGVYGALRGTTIATRVEDAVKSGRVYVLGEDFKARGLDEGKMIEGINVVDYAGFVDLATECDRVQSWL